MTTLTVITLVLAVYYLVYHLGTIWIVMIAAREIGRETRWPHKFEEIETFSNPLAPTVSVIVPAHNEEMGILAAVDSLRHLRYPALEILVIDDGSTDRTLDVLMNRYELRQRRPSHPDDRVLQLGETLSEFETPDGVLRVVQKRSMGRRADAVNAGLRVARGELVCMIDADSMLAPDSLLRLVVPFMDDPSIVASGGTVLPENGISFRGGNPTKTRLPKKWIERFQVVEYLRAFILGRSGWARRNGLTIISGAFGLCRREAVLRIGGLEGESLAEDADLLLGVHADHVERAVPYRVVFDARALCWTEAPAELSQLRSQRIRWAHGLDEILSKYRRMLFNPKYRVLGMFAMPWLLAYEYAAPFLAIFGFAISVLGVATGWVALDAVLLLGITGIGLATIVGIFAITVQVMWLRLYVSLGQVLLLFLTSLIEPLVYRPLTFIWQIRGIWRGRRGIESQWGVMQRKGALEADGD
ncbi:MAG: glycosyltransferase family 2 protein [Actinobacteria bacterium]|nr:glycosyltransferase family 2 protein [Actinomycetota bacterium]